MVKGRKKPICALSELSELECREFNFGNNQLQNKGFLMKAPTGVVAYQNSCPHTGASLNWQENQFLDIFNSHIQCAIHGAIFRIEDGFCIRGPCTGRSLKKIELIVDNDQIFIDSAKD